MNGRAIFSGGAGQAKRNRMPYRQFVPDTLLGIWLHGMLDGQNRPSLKLCLDVLDIFIIDVPNMFVRDFLNDIILILMPCNSRTVLTRFKQ